MEKSRYALLVKLKKKSLGDAERELIAANNDAAAAAERLSHAYEVLRTLSIPLQGSTRELSRSNAMIRVQHTLIHQHKEALETAQNNQQQKRELYNRALVEFEKFNYLEALELGERKKKFREQEAKIMDELGAMIPAREKE